MLYYKNEKVKLNAHVCSFPCYNYPTMNVLAVFKDEYRHPRPIRFKLTEDGEEKTVEVKDILKIEDVGAGGVSRIEYTCQSAGVRGLIKYKLLYYYNTGKWSIVKK